MSTRTERLKALAVEYFIAIRERQEDCRSSSEEDLLEYLDGTESIERWVAVTHAGGGDPSPIYYLKAFPTREQAEARTVAYVDNDMYAEIPVAVVDLDGEGEQWGKRYPLLELRPVFAVDAQPLEAPHYGMYTPEGDTRVHQIVQDVLAGAGDRNLDDLHAEAVSYLDNLIHEPGYQEALDTAVRDAVFVALSNLRTEET